MNSAACCGTSGDPGCGVDPADRAVVDPNWRRTPGDWQFTKWRYSAFFRSELRDQMREAGRDQLIICGVYAHVGVLATAVEALSHDIQAFLVADAIADFSAGYHRMALEYAAGRCAVVVTTATLIEQLWPPAPPDAGGPRRMEVAHER